ncbi:MAG: hypothetical protein ACI90V_010409, partial [Bacillariaceae sp.]
IFLRIGWMDSLTTKMRLLNDKNTLSYDFRTATSRVFLLLRFCEFARTSKKRENKTTVSALSTEQSIKRSKLS